MENSISINENTGKKAEFIENLSPSTIVFQDDQHKTDKKEISPAQNILEPITVTFHKSELSFDNQALKDEPQANNNHETNNEAPYLKSLEWLSAIMNETIAKKGKYFSIFNKAYSLYKDLGQEPDLLEQIQEATCKLALNLAFIKSEDDQENRMQTVPKKLESDFIYFMDMPLRYLKKLRFEFVTRLLQQLGGEIDTSREGARIAIKLNGIKAFLHLHDSENGILDSGRIVSLRKLMIDAGFRMKD